MLTKTSNAPALARERDWVNILFLGSAHALALFAIVYMAAVQFSWWTFGLGTLWAGLCGLAITGGYHRCFSHPTHKASWLLRAFYLAFGAASVQNSALKWSADHRIHHARTDKDEDPYNISRGFWWAHIGWILWRDRSESVVGVHDLEADPLVRFQHRWYVPLATAFGFVLPACLGFLWGDPIGALLVAGFLRLVLQWHSTFSVNSVAHTLGSRPFNQLSSARDSFWTAIITLGEGYHNFHHRFPMDYRNGARWYHLDPTKWFLWTSARFGLTRDLRRTPKERIRAARTAPLVKAS